jgi:phosphoenolpyruvate-protein phosphotransferase
MFEKKIYSPLEGTVIAIEKTSDPVFSEKMLGDGIAIRPSLAVHTVVAPFDGVIQTLNENNHALALVGEDGIELLIHIGIDTVLLRGKGFKPFVKQGDSVKKGDKLIQADFNFLVNNAPSIDTILVFTNLGEDKKLIKTTKTDVKLLEEIIIVADNNLNVSLNQELFDSSSSLSLEKNCTVINLTGIHARPASFIMNVANKFKAKVEIKKGDKTVNAKSVISILSLGAKYQEEVKIIATGEDANEALIALEQAFKDGLGEGNEHVSATAKPKKEQATTTLIQSIDFSKEVKLKGVVASPGLVIGKSMVLKEEIIEIEEKACADCNKERVVLEDAIASVKDKLRKDIVIAEDLDQKSKIEIFNAHLTILGDEELMSSAKDFIVLGKSAAFAWRSAIKGAIDVLNSTGNKLLMERVADFKDIEKRVIKVILGIPETNISFKDGVIIVANDLVPSDLTKFDSNVKGVILGAGSATSHVAIMLRNMGVPALVALGSSIIDMPNDINIVLDANEAFIFANLTEEQLLEIKEKQAKLNAIKQENISNSKQSAITVDGYKMHVMGNVSNAKEAKKAHELGGEGIGLLRTEFLFFNSQNAPEEAEQNNLYQEVLDAMQGYEVTLRTLDVGGDKPLAYVEIGHEENPIMGLRGVRNYFNNQEIFLTQVRAILKTKPVMLSKIMVPMVAEVSEIIRVKEMIEAEKTKLGIKDKIQIGTMIEVPSAAIMADKIAKHVDFFSIGTNDLAQYTMAMDRGNPNLTSKLNNLHPAILKLIKITVDGGNKAGIPTAVCGAMASEIRSIPILVGLGIKELSTSMRSIPDVKALIRTLSYEKCKKVAEQAMEMESAEDVIALVKKEFNL